MHEDFTAKIVAKLLDKLGIGKMVERHVAIERALEQLRDGLDQIKEKHKPEWEHISAELREAAASTSPIIREAFEKVFARGK